MRARCAYLGTGIFSVVVVLGVFLIVITFLDETGGTDVGLGSDGLIVVGLSFGGTFFWGSDVNFVKLESGNLLVDDTEEP